MTEWLESLLPPPPGLTFNQRLTMIGGMFAGLLVTALICGALRLEVNSKLWLMAPLGASAAQIFSIPSSPMSQPWPLILGHMLSALAGLIAFHLLGHTSLAAALSVALAAGLMIQCRALHPSGGGTALFVVLSQTSDWGYIFFPVAINAFILCSAAVAWHRFTGQAYPKSQRISRAPHNIALHKFEPADLDAALRSVGTLDISPEDAERLIEVTELQAFKRMARGLTCGDIMVKRVRTIGTGVAAGAALQLMSRYDVNALPVIDDAGFTVGLLRLEEAKAAGPTDPASSIMMVDFFQRTPEASISDLIDLFEQSARRYVLVVREGKLLGLIAKSDLMAALFHAAA